MEALVVLARIYPKTNMEELCEVLEWGSISILGRVRSALFLGREERGFQCRDYAGAIGSLQQGIALVFKLPILLRSQRSQAVGPGEPAHSSLRRRRYFLQEHPLITYVGAARD